MIGRALHHEGADFLGAHNVTPGGSVRATDRLVRGGSGLKLILLPVRLVLSRNERWFDG